ncbi:carboxypeptidase M32 [Candidatus Lokiarchaeum ossiferum]|uniref:carboxypeptidase M32 n=1 Tax=Candidatus Lokiarchaeum ossiferum TaxID=2951803 RepID=UPI00352E81FF
MTKTPYETLCLKMKEATLLGQAQGILAWDNYCYMPEKGIDQRSQQLALLSKLIHQWSTDPVVGQLLKDSSQMADITPIQQRNLALWQKEYDRETKIPTDLVQKVTEQSAKTEHLWRTAREKNDFKLVQLDLEKLFELRKEYGAKLDESKSPYNNLLDMYEPNMTEAMVSEYFSVLKEGSIRVMKKCLSAADIPDPAIIRLKTPIPQQEQISKLLMDLLGLTPDKSRLDKVAHPFTIGAYDDVRITTHYLEGDPIGCMYSVIHEGGHALYELNLPDEHRYTAIGRSVGLGVHESQSRFAENIIGRNPEFLGYLLPKIQEIAPVFKDISLSNFVKAVNGVQATKVRIYADEVTYSLHVIMRFEIEKMLFNDQCTIAELPQVWNNKIEEFFGLKVDSDAEGVMQDTHWYGGMFGYFPDYALGNVYDGSFYNQMKKDVPEWESQLKVGNTKEILTWLDTKVQKMGSLYDPADLVEHVTGEKPNAKYFIDYLDEKYQKIFNY